MEEAVDQFLAGMSAEDLQGLDAQMQAMIRQQFTALVHVCLTSTSLMKNLEAAMMNEAIGFVEDRLAVMDVAEMFLAQYADEEEAKNEIITAFDEATPEVIAGGPTGRSSVTKLCVLAVPPGPSAEAFRGLVRQALADVEIVDAVSTDDIILYREWPHLPLAELELFGSVGRDAYKQMNSVEHFTPHTRTDIPRWHGPAAERPTGNREQGSTAR